MSTKLLKNNEFICGVLFILFAIMTFFQTVGGDSEVMLFPRLIAVFSLFMGVGSIVITLRSKTEVKKKKSTNHKVEIIFSLFMILSMTLINVLGFYTCLFLICCGCYGLVKFISLKDTPSSKVEFISNVLLFSLLTTIVVYLVFNMLLNVITPSGLLI